MGAPERDVVVTGIGLVSAAGGSAERLHRFVLDGGCAFAPDSGLVEHGLPPVPTAAMPDFDAGMILGPRSLRPLDRTARLAAAAAKRALAAAGLGGSDAAEDRAEIGLVLGTLFGSLHTISEFDHRALTAGPQYAKPMDFANSVINAAAGQTAILHRLTGLNATISAGGASGVKAIAWAADQIRAGRARVLLAGGAEELSIPALLGYHRRGLLWSGNGTGACPVPFDAGRNGLAAAEGAALLVLESGASAESRGARVLATIHGSGSGFDPSRGAAPERARSAAARALRQALAASGLDARSIAAVSASANATAADRREGEALAEVFGASGGPPVTAVKASLGDAQGAAGALEVALLVESLRYGELPGVRNLVWPETPDLALSTAPRSIAPGPGVVLSTGLGGRAEALVVSIPETLS